MISRLKQFWRAMRGQRPEAPRAFLPWVEEAARLMREAGLEAEGKELLARAEGVYTTSSELCGEVGNAIRKAQDKAGKRMPERAKRLLDEAITEIQKVWPWI